MNRDPCTVCSHYLQGHVLPSCLGVFPAPEPLLAFYCHLDHSHAITWYAPSVSYSLQLLFLVTTICKLLFSTAIPGTPYTWATISRFLCIHVACQHCSFKPLQPGASKHLSSISLPCLAIFLLVCFLCQFFFYHPLQLCTLKKKKTFCAPAGFHLVCSIFQPCPSGQLGTTKNHFSMLPTPYSLPRCSASQLVHPAGGSVTIFLLYLLVSWEEKLGAEGSWVQTVLTETLVNTTRLPLPE